MVVKLARPKVRDVAPRIANEIEPKMQKLGIEKAALEEEGRQIQRKSDQHDMGVADAARQARIAAILGHRLPEQPKPQRTRLHEIIERVGDIEAALAIMNEDAKVERKQAAAKILAAVEPVHRRLAETLGDALLKLQAANMALWRFYNDLDGDGVNIGRLGDFRSTRLGNPQDQYSAVPALLCELAGAGFVSKSQLPAEVRP
ncbi:hypothetical protein [Mesorhizobium sp. NZP2234]|uniref:hypothetical protein n=1 Tax=Mesorhizobium sp. NZP2234 TaxID=2483402 RepID=UPI001552F42E|nr:hypothetical protein [Mesorhizobium sp. NZP2234]